MQITNVKFSFEENIKTGDYQSRKAGAEITANVQEGEDAGAVLAKCGDLARNHVWEQLSIQPISKGAAVQPVQAAVAITSEPNKRRTKKDMEAEALANAAGKPPADGALLEEAPPVIVGTGVPGAVEDDWAEEAMPPKPVTDKELTEACQKHASRTGDPANVRKVLKDHYNIAPPQRTTELPQDKRAEFIMKLEALPAKAAA